jgi:uncharacterized protein (DUF1697 family)
MAAYVSLFRGINVGGNHQVKMEKLKALHEALGLRNVVPYIQSGNVVFQSDSDDVAALRSEIEERFEETFGFHSEVFVRTPAELAAIIERNPFDGHLDKAPNRVMVMFLASCPDEAAREALVQAHAGPEELFVIGQEVYLYYPDGAGRSKLSGSFMEKKLKTLGTARNWNTVLQLQKMMQP